MADPLPELVLFVPPGGGKSHPYRGGGRLTWLATGADTAGRYALCSATEDPGDQNPPHVHSREDEAFYIVSGHFTGEGNGQAVPLAPGDYLHLPRGIPHHLLNASQTEPGETLMLLAPAGLEGFFMALGFDGANDRAKVAKLAAESYGNPLLPPEEFAAKNAPGGEYSKLAPDGQRILKKSTTGGTADLLAPGETSGQYTLRAWQGTGGEGGKAESGATRAVYVAGGRVTLTADGREFDAPAGAFLHAPPYAEVSWAAAGADAARLLVWTFHRS